MKRGEIITQNSFFNVAFLPIEFSKFKEGKIVMNSLRGLFYL